ncbi:hypothetical protein EYF80_008695 [Liparis tanakae]|uniref:Uncharacterized protein n=1 Tax=Liparis tanakae TaxID=230148 RepID=A0A4Z2ISQ3_9TELE|nr:hypothetical protein EYF80_008695 [Liparis tanakae]
MLHIESQTGKRMQTQVRVMLQFLTVPERLPAGNHRHLHLLHLPGGDTLHLMALEWILDMGSGMALRSRAGPPLPPSSSSAGGELQSC